VTRPASIRVRAEAVLEAAGPAGMLSEEIAAAIGVSRKTLWVVVWHMGADGLVGWWPDPHGRVANRRRYWLTKFKPAKQPRPTGPCPSDLCMTAPPQQPFKRSDGVCVLPHQPVYSRHQLAALPAGYRSALNPSECRAWARVAAQGMGASV
jgi:hypothetical protein